MLRFSSVSVFSCIHALHSQMLLSGRLKAVKWATWFVIQAAFVTQYYKLNPIRNYFRRPETHFWWLHSNTSSKICERRKLCRDSSWNWRCDAVLEDKLHGEEWRFEVQSSVRTVRSKIKLYTYPDWLVDELLSDWLDQREKEIRRLLWCKYFLKIKFWSEKCSFALPRSSDAGLSTLYS